MTLCKATFLKYGYSSHYPTIAIRKYDIPLLYRTSTGLRGQLYGYNYVVEQSSKGDSKLRRVMCGTHSLLHGDMHFLIFFFGGHLSCA